MGNWIKSAVKQPGALHKALGVKQGQKIPASELEPDPHDSPTTAKRKNFARTMRKINK